MSARSKEHMRVLDLFAFPDSAPGELSRHFAAAHTRGVVHRMLEEAGVRNVNQLMDRVKESVVGGSGGMGTSTAKKVLENPLHIELGSLKKVCDACGADFEHIKLDLIAGWDWDEYATAYEGTVARMRDAATALLQLSGHGQDTAIALLRSLAQTDAASSGTIQARVNGDVLDEVAPAIAALRDSIMDEDAGQHRRLDGGIPAF